MRQQEAEALVLREARALDERDWDGWLALLTEDVEYWVPAWVDEERTSSDPDSELSLIHLRGRAEVEDRVFRIRTGDSAASTPLPRTVHLVTNVLVDSGDAAHLVVSAAWLVHQYSRPKGSRTHGGHYRYELRWEGESLRIARKHIRLLDDGLDIPLDVYNL